MTLTSGLVCGINVYFVVDFLPTLHGLEYHIPLGLLLAAYLAFVAYLVGLAPRARGGTVSLVGAYGPVVFAFRSGHAALHTGPGSWPEATIAGSILVSPSTQHGPTDRSHPCLLSIPTSLPSMASSDRTQICSESEHLSARDTPSKERVYRLGDLLPRSWSSALLPIPNPRQFRGAASGLMRGEWDSSGRFPHPLAQTLQ